MKKQILSLTILVVLLALASTQKDPCLNAPNGFISDPTSCNHYWSCSGGRGQRQGCPPAFPIFYQSRQICDVDDGSCEVFCPATSTEIKSKPVEGSCTKYLMCVRGVLLERECGPGLGYDYIYQDCDVEVAADCLTCNLDGKLYKLPDKKDCSGYYICLNGAYAQAK